MEGNVKRVFHPNSDSFTIIMDSGTSDHSVQDKLVPRSHDSMRGYKKLKNPRTIVTAGNETIFATATCIIWEHIDDQGGQLAPVRISAMIVPKLGRSNYFYSVKANNWEVSTILETGNSHLKVYSSKSLSRNHHPEDKGQCS